MPPTIVFREHTIAPEPFQDRVLRSARVLQSAGIGEGAVVALMMRNSPQLLELMLAARWLGAMWCPINWHYKTEEVQYILGDSGARVLVIDAALLAGLPGLRLDTITHFVHDDGLGASAPAATAPDWEHSRDAATPLDEPARAPRGAMLYTSGTTGRPKGIVREAASPEKVASSLTVLRQVLGFRPGMRALVSAPMYHSAPNTYCVGAALEGAELFIEPRFDAEHTLRMIERHRITHAYLVPTMYVRMLALPEEVRKRYDLGSMQFVASTGSPCAPEVKRAMIDWWGPVINEAYGSSELGYSTLLNSADALRKPGSAGRPLPGARFAILDEQGAELPSGQPGLIYLHQDAYADFSYIGNPEARRRMEKNGLKTLGDVGYLDEDGFLFIVDRASDMVISGGVNIYPAEIEAVLQSMPGVADCAVFGIPDAEFGEALGAAVQLQPGAAVSAEQVGAFLKERLAGYKVPKVVEFVAQMPREDTGKIFKRKLREPYWAGMARRI
ncbi:MAG: AMP-binding protein [Rhodoferax sp.]|nr:AMP-binding protein [Rhodoferax sp.]